jgi:outer membrane protein TolC
MDQAVTVQAEPDPVPYAVDAEVARRHALEHRAEIQDAAADLRRAELTLQEVDARRQVKGELSAFYDLVGISEPGLDDPSVGDQLDSSWEDLRRRPGNRGVTLSLSVPLWDAGVNAAEVAAARAALHRQDLDREENRRLVIQQVNAALTRLREAEARLKVLERSREVSRRSFEISQERFANGDITSQELALDRDRWTSSRLSWLDAWIQYELAGADLKRQTLYDFQEGRSLVEVGAGGS